VKDTHVLEDNIKNIIFGEIVSTVNY